MGVHHRWRIWPVGHGFPQGLEAGLSGLDDFRRKNWVVEFTYSFGAAVLRDGDTHIMAHASVGKTAASVGI